MKKIILSLFVVASFVSCKKDKDEKCDLSQASFVGTYKITAVKSKATPTSAEVDEFALWDACEKDDLVIFNANNTTTYTDAGTVCTPDGNGTGIWTLSGSNINIDGETGVVAYFDCKSAAVTLTDATTGESTTISLARQ